MKKTVNLVVVVAACMMIAFYAASITTHAGEEAGNKWVQCGQPADIHGGAIKVEHDKELQVFCCPKCIDNYKREHQDKSHKDEGHNVYKSHDKQ